MTENYYMVQQLLPFYFSNPKNRDFFYNTISKNPENMQIFFEKELYGWTKDDFYRQKLNDKTAVAPETERTWNYRPIQSRCLITENKEWIIIFVNFPPEFVVNNLDSIAVAIALKSNIDKSIQIELFTLEAGSDLLGNPAVYVCGKDINSGKHSNFGKINFGENFMSLFVDKVASLLNENT